MGRRAAAAIDNARLYGAALTANQAKANFLATMSHELQTPLTAIIGYGELLADGITGSVSDIQRQQLQRIKQSAVHLLSLIEEIPLHARAEAGRETIRIEPVLAKSVLDEAIAFVSPSIVGTLVNLLANAVKFTASGEVVARAFADGNDVVFEVQDTGIGIREEHLESIFDPFWQVEQHTTRRAGGSGLGLAVTRNLATLLRGTVTVATTPGVGSTVRVVLPQKQPSE